MSGKPLFERLGETKLTSLKFTDTRDGFGKQIDDEPLITKSLPNDPYATSNYIGIAPNKKQAADENKERITKFFQTPRGKEFINKQIGLQLSNTRLESVQGFSFNIGKVNVSPGLITDVINIGKDIWNNGLNENNALSAVTALKRPVTRTAISAVQIYNPQNTIDQIGSDPNTGWNHYDRFGATNIILDSDKYLSIVTQNNDGSQSTNNRLVILNKSLGTGLESERELNKLAEKLTNGLKTVRKFTNKVNSFVNQGLGIVNSLGLQNNSAVASVTSKINQGLNFVNNKLALADRFSAPFTNNIIDQYEGGPGSINGVGPTIIKRYDNTSGNEKLPTILDAADASLNRSRNLLVGIANISQQYTEDTGENLYGELNDPKEISNKIYDGRNYESIRQMNLPSPKKSVGKVILDEGNRKYTYNIEYHTPKEIPLDKNPNIKYQYFGESGKFKEFDRFIPQTQDEVKDYNASINRVVFTPINPFTGKPFLDPPLDGGATDLNAGRLFFDAYVNNFKDNFSPTWSDINYIGRSETFHVFNKFKRDVSFTLQIPCFNPIQLRNRHRALYELASINAGSYNNNKLGGVITYLKLGNYLAPNQLQPNGHGTYNITGEPGIITNFSITVPNDSSWDIDEQLAHYLTVDIGFKLIHNTRPERQRGGFISSIGSYLGPNYEATTRKQQAMAQDAEGEVFRQSLNDSSRGVGSSLENFKRFNQVTKATKLQTGKTFSTSDFKQPEYRGEGEPILDSVPFEGTGDGYGI